MDFLATMSHELRTPLNAIGGYVELIEMGIHGPVTDTQRDALGRIQSSQRHLLGLITDVLNFAKLDAGKVEYHLADVPVATVIGSVEGLVAPQVAARRLRFAIEGECDGMVVRADEEKLRQVLLNILSNAIRHTPTAGAIVVSCAEDDDKVRIAVRDSGVGIPAGKLQSIFEPFVQLDRTLSQPKDGTGLGLAISRELARAMGGEIEVESVEGAGSTFTVVMPSVNG
jgi:signal transduction histidine kinase